MAKYEKLDSRVITWSEGGIKMAEVPQIFFTWKCIEDITSIYSNCVLENSRTLVSNNIGLMFSISFCDYCGNFGVISKKFDKGVAYHETADQ